jgi:hypothetical protein
MKRLVCLCLFVLISLTLSVSASTQQSPAPSSGKRETLTNEAIINLSKARFKEGTIITLIRTSPTAFDLSTTKLIELKKRGVSERIVLEMIARQTYLSSAPDLATMSDDDFFSKEDEAFFNSSPTLKLPDKRGGDKAKENETDVFGSRSGSQNKNQSRGLGGANGERSGETEVTGSATVRLIKPSSEAGGAPKLERAPKLDNQAILELIQAGFSEGTILRKIEASQVEFDISPKAIAALRQNRVSERIIKAMTDAMDDGKK